MQRAEWTRVKDTHTALTGDYVVHSMHRDMKAENAKRLIRSFISGQRGVFLFDPEEYKRHDPTLTKELRKLSNEELLRYATMASKIRRDISR